MPDEPIEQQPPDVLAMILADTVLHETPTGKFFIEGTYSAIFVHDFPHVQPMIVVFLCITSGHGRTPIRIRLIDVDETTDPIFEADATLEFEDPLQVLETVFVARNVRFPAPGEYRLQIFGAGQFLRERRLQVIPEPGIEDEESGETHE